MAEAREWMALHKQCYIFPERHLWYFVFHGKSRVKEGILSPLHFIYNCNYNPAKQRSSTLRSGCFLDFLAE